MNETKYLSFPKIESAPDEIRLTYEIIANITLLHAQIDEKIKSFMGTLPYISNNEIKSLKGRTVGKTLYNTFQNWIKPYKYRIGEQLYKDIERWVTKANKLAKKRGVICHSVWIFEEKSHKPYIWKMGDQIRGIKEGNGLAEDYCLHEGMSIKSLKELRDEVHKLLEELIPILNQLCIQQLQLLAKESNNVGDIIKYSDIRILGRPPKPLRSQNRER